MKHPEAAFRSQAVLDREWSRLGYAARPDFRAAVRQFDAFLAVLDSSGVRLHHLPEDAGTGPDSVYTHDPATAGHEGLVLCRMGKSARADEPQAIGRWAGASGFPVVGAIEPPGLLEGGDAIWLDDATIAVGIGYRSNLEGARQLADLMQVALVPVPLPHWNGPGDVLHLMSLISPIDHDLALVCRRLLAVPFLQELERRGITLVDVPDDEFETLGCNVLAVGPRRCVMVDGNPQTRNWLEKAGCEVQTFEGSEISLKGMGGPTCLTRPTLRDPV